MKRHPIATFAVFALLAASSALAQTRVEDEYVRYELLAPSTHSFRVIYDVSAVTAGAGSYTDPIPRGVQTSEVSVIDLTSGTSLLFRQTPERIDVALARPVPKGGQASIRILATYTDAKSYRSDGTGVVFNPPTNV